MNKYLSRQTLAVTMGFVFFFVLNTDGQIMLPSQWTGTGTSTGSPDIEFRADGTLIEKGATNSAPLSNADLQSTSHFIWYPLVGALRVGGNAGESVSNMGANSVAFGYSSASGPTSIAGMSGSASGAGSMAIGYGAQSTGNYSLALGYFASATSNSSVSIGSYGTSSGQNSFALGDVLASGNYSFASGYLTSAKSYDAFVMGTFNTGATETGTGSPSLTSWVTTDPLFEIGNGTSAQKSDALVVFKDGSAKFAGPVTVPQSGDIPMYTGN